MPSKAESQETPAPSPLAEDGYVSGLRPVPVADHPIRRPLPVSELTGTTPLGSVLHIDLVGRPWTLLCFLATRCDGCEEFWRRICGSGRTRAPDHLSPLVITKSNRSVDTDEVRALAGECAGQVLMSDEAWEAFGVFGYPSFILVDGLEASVVGERVAFAWSDVESLLAASAPGIFAP